MRAMIHDALTFLITKFFKMLWDGTVKASLEDKNVATRYICLVAVLFIIGLVFKVWGFVVLVLIAVATIVAIRGYIKDFPQREKERFYRDTFTAINFKASDGCFPEYLSESELSEYATTVYFLTVIPLNKWLDRKDELSMYFNKKVIGIEQNTKDNMVE
ncbi:MAG: hypothetical protein FWH04_10030 [Oscillospiraceae bacterium]|nr:hypothetical protein [Oscillospiraceae bacterium]